MYKQKGSHDFQLNKLDAKFLGPYLVLTHEHNNVTVRNLITDAISVFHSGRLKLFFGSQEQAYEAALRDSEQYEIEEFLAYRGDPLFTSFFPMAVTIGKIGVKIYLILYNTKNIVKRSHSYSLL